jgi:hypothetical protein
MFMCRIGGSLIDATMGSRKCLSLVKLKWARENNSPWVNGTCFFAAMGGHFDILKRAIENGCPWDANMTLSMIRDGNENSIAHCTYLEIVGWLQGIM